MKLIQLIHPIFAAAVNIDNNGNVTPGSGSNFVDPGKLTIGGAVSKGVNVFAFVIGAISIIMVLVGALRYVLSGGNPQSTKEAKDTILYAVVGLVVAILSLAIIRFVTGSFGL